MNKRELQKEERRTGIIAKAKELVLNIGIQDLQLQDVAKEVEIGIATFYRYFPNKQLLVLAVNTLITKEMTEKLQQIANEDILAIDQFEKVLNFYIEVVDELEHKFIRFVKAFESYRPQSSDSREFQEYLFVRREYADVLFQIAEKGKKDGSLRQDLDLAFTIVTFVQNISYFSAETTLTVHDPELPVKLDAKKQLLMLKDVFLNYMRP